MKKIILGLLIWINNSAVIGQPSDTLDKKINFGFLLGANEITTINGHLGFSIGTLMDYRLTRKIFLQPQFLFSLFDYKKASVSFEMLALEVPVYAVIKPINTLLKPTVSFGPNYKFDLFSSSSGWYADLAFGLEKRLQYFTIEPQLRYSYGRTMQTFYFMISIK